uniref:TPX2 domain-containing protein n=1 Tax=Panagrellus redivivus TaxID=6233 RepID=A0A7E4VQJ1_PANRE
MSAPAPLTKQAEAKIDSVLNTIPVPRFVDFSNTAQVRSAADCDAYWKRATESQRKKADNNVQPLPDMSKLRIQDDPTPAPVKAIEQEDFSDLAIKNPSQRLREKARRRSQQIIVEPEVVKKPVAAPAPVKSVPKPAASTNTAKPILSARDRRVVRPAEPTTSASSRYEPYSTTTRSSSTTRAIPPPSAPITRSMARRSASTVSTKDPVVPAIRPRRSDSVKSDSQPPLSRRSEANPTTKSGLTRRSSNVINYFLSEKTIESVASIGRKLRSVSKGRS